MKWRVFEGHNTAGGAPMLSMIMLAAAQTVSAAPAQPPVIQTVPRAAAAPPVSITENPDSFDNSQETAIFDVDARSGNELLWAGEMRVSGRQGASFTRQQSNASTSSCARGQTSYGQGERSSLSINLNRYRAGRDEGGVQMRVTWERPGEGDTCQGANARTAGITENLFLERGQERIVKGDGGLIIRLRRR